MFNDNYYSSWRDQKVMFCLVSKNDIEYLEKNKRFHHHSEFVNIIGKRWRNHLINAEIKNRLHDIRPDLPTLFKTNDFALIDAKTYSMIKIWAKNYRDLKNCHNFMTYSYGMSIREILSNDDFKYIKKRVKFINTFGKAIVKIGDKSELLKYILVPEEGFKNNKKLMALLTLAIG
jgi:hypothetical protein